LAGGVRTKATLKKRHFGPPRVNGGAEAAEDNLRRNPRKRN